MLSERLVVVSVDSHVSPDVAAYRPYCEPGYRDDLERYIAEIDQHLLGGTAAGEASARSERYAAEVAGYADLALNADPDRRLRDMDGDGVALDTVFHGGFNFFPLPFFGGRMAEAFSQDVPATRSLRDQRAAGIRMYNRWLADWVGTAPDRLLGVAHIPVWDLQATLAELRAAHALGIRGVNFPSSRRELPGYNDPSWYPLWELCCELRLPLFTHGGAGDIFPNAGPGAFCLRLTEMPFAARRAIGQMILGGVFERFPELRLVMVEQVGTWVVDTLTMLDSTYHSPLARSEVPYIQDLLPRLPSEYFAANVFVGASFMARVEAETAIEHGYWANVLWGRDYPHPEGCWPHTLASLRATFAGLPAEPRRAMLGERAVQVLGLDADRLRAVADRIGPTRAELDEPLAEVPAGADHVSMAFRRLGYWS